MKTISKQEPLTLEHKFESRCSKEDLKSKVHFSPTCWFLVGHEYLVYRIWNAKTQHCCWYTRQEFVRLKSCPGGILNNILNNLLDEFQTALASGDLNSFLTAATGKKRQVNTLVPDDTNLGSAPFRSNRFNVLHLCIVCSERTVTQNGRDPFFMPSVHPSCQYGRCKKWSSMRTLKPCFYLQRGCMQFMNKIDTLDMEEAPPGLRD